MKNPRRILALMLCMIIAAAPLQFACAEEQPAMPEAVIVPLEEAAVATPEPMPELTPPP